MIERIAVRVATWIHTSNPEETAPIETLAYNLAVYLSYILIVGASLTIGYFTGAFIDTVLTLISFQLLRKFSGGFHLPLTVCVIVSTAILSAAPHVDMSQEAAVIIGTCSIVILYAFAPAFKPGTIRAGRVKQRKLLSIALAVAALLLMNPIFIKAFFLQAVTTIRPLRGGEQVHEKIGS